MSSVFGWCFLVFFFGVQVLSFWQMLFFFKIFGFAWWGVLFGTSFDLSCLLVSR